MKRWKETGIKLGKSEVKEVFDRQNVLISSMDNNTERE